MMNKKCRFRTSAIVLTIPLLGRKELHINLHRSARLLNSTARAR